MFEKAKVKRFIAKVKAHIYAQHDDRSFVEEITDTPEVSAELTDFRLNSPYGSLAVAPFLAACNVYCMHIERTGSREKAGALCVRLLKESLVTAKNDQRFYAEFEGFVDKIEERLLVVTAPHGPQDAGRQAAS